MPDLTPADPAETILRASRALGKIDLYGKRGLTLVSVEEIEAMAMMLALHGHVPLAPDAPAPADIRTLMFTPS